MDFALLRVGTGGGDHTDEMRGAFGRISPSFCRSVDGVMMAVVGRPRLEGERERGAHVSGEGSQNLVGD